MLEKLEIIRMAQALASHAGARQGEIARNIANADTPGFRARDLADFAESYAAGSQTAMRATRPGHIAHATPFATETEVRHQQGAAAPDGNTVSLETEMVKAAEVRQQHEMALAIYRSTAGILRSSLGKAG